MKSEMIDGLRERGLRPDPSRDSSLPFITARRGHPHSWRPLQVPMYSADIGVIGTLLLALVFVANPTGLAFERMTLTKHIPLLIGIVSLLFAAVTAALDPARKAWPRQTGLARLSCPFLLLAGWVIVGSLYARVVDDIDNTFLTIGLYMLAVPGMALYIVCSNARWRVVSLYMTGLSISAALMLLVMIAEHVGSGGYYHELEFLVVPVGVYYALRPGNNIWHTALATFYILGGLVFLKLTGFLALGVALAYLWIVRWRFRYREDDDFRRVARCCIVVGVLAGGAAGAFLLSHRGHVGPDGNLGYRLVTYRTALDRFLESPVYGESFDISATAHFTGFQINAANGNLPTHSDFLDFAANGGLLALSLLAWGYVRVLVYTRKTIFAQRANSDMSAAAHALACTTLTGIVVYSFNPILLEPDRALLLWSTTGMLLGMAIRHEQIPNPSTGTLRDEKRNI